MSYFVIEGPSKLNGEVQVSGSKNAALPIIAATILAKGKFTLKNIPHIRDISTMLSILEDLGAKTSFVENVCTIDTTNINSFTPNAKKVRNARASILLIGSLLARFGEVKVAHPGGCFIGARPVTTHLDCLRELGAKTLKANNSYHLKADKLVGKKIAVDFFSVTGTETLLMAAVLSEGKTEIRLAATEPHVVDLCNFLVKMGAKISGIGTHNLIVTGVKKLKPITYKIIPDQIEAGTFAIAAAASRGEVIIKDFVESHHEMFLKKLKEVGVKYEFVAKNNLKIYQTTSFFPTEIQTNIFPGFPTDLQSPFAILLTQADGTSSIQENIFEGRFGYLNELGKMGADCMVKGSHEAMISGPTPLYGTTIQSLDLRAGATLIIAAIIAEGESIIENAEIIDRGYEKIEEKLQKLGVKIKRKKLIKTK